MALFQTSTLFAQNQPGGMFAVSDFCPRANKHTGNKFFVHSGTGTDAAGYGRDPSNPFATVEYAINNGVTAGQDDVIIVMAGHNEGAIAAIFDLDKAATHVIGCGEGGNRPIFDYDNAAATIDMGADNCSIENIQLRPSVTDVLIGIDIEAGMTGWVLRDVEVIEGEDGAGVDDFALGIDIKAGCHKGRIENYKQRQHASGAGYIAGIRLTGASDDIEIVNPDIVLTGAAAVAPINGITTLSTNVRVIGGNLESDDEPGIELLTGTTGILRDNLIFSDLATIAAAIVADGCALHQNYYIEVGGESQVIIGTPSVDD
jgi:hypothetical protein